MGNVSLVSSIASIGFGMYSVIQKKKKRTLGKIGLLLNGVMALIIIVCIIVFVWG